MARRRLVDIELSRGSRAVRRALFWAIAVGGGFATFTYILPSHTSGYGSTWQHSDYADSGYVPLLGLAGVTVLVTWLARRRFGGGMIAGLIAGIASCLEFARAVFFHLLSGTHDAAPHVIHFLALIAMFGASVLMLFIEPVLYLVERSSLERAEATIPAARVVNS